MKRLILILAGFFTLTSGAFASDIECRSEMYSISIPRIEDFSFASYYVAEEMSRGVDQTLEKLDVSEQQISFTIAIGDGATKYDISVDRTRAGRYSGKIQSGDLVQGIDCLREY